MVESNNNNNNKNKNKNLIKFRIKTKTKVRIKINMSNNRNNKARLNLMQLIVKLDSFNNFHLRRPKQKSEVHHLILQNKGISKLRISISTSTKTNRI